MKMSVCYVVTLLTLFASCTYSMKPEEQGKQEVSIPTFMEAIREGSIFSAKQYISNGINVNIQSKNGITLLMLAVMKGHVKMVELLLAAHASVNVRDIHGNTPLSIALSTAANAPIDNAETLIENAETLGEIKNLNYWIIAVKLIEAGAPLDKKALSCKASNEWESTRTKNELKSQGYSLETSILPSLCTAAARMGSIQCLKRLADMQVQGQSLLTFLIHNSYKKSLGGAFFLACLDGQVETARFLAQHGVNINIKNGEGETPLSCAAERGDIKIVELLIELGSDIHKSGEYALRAAAKNGHTQVIELLLKHGVEVQHIDGYADSPLLCAIEGRQLAVVKMLLQAGAHASDETEDMSAVESAIWDMNPEIVKVLVEHGAAVDDNDSNLNELLTVIIKGDSERLTALLKTKAELINAIPRTGSHYTPLMFACLLGEMAIVKILISAGADIHQKDSNGCNALAYAAAIGNEPLIALLITQGSTVSSQVIFRAIEHGHYDLARNLVQKWTDVKDYHIPLNAAIKAQQKHLIVTLIQAGADLVSLAKEDSFYYRPTSTNETIRCLIEAAQQPEFKHYLRMQKNDCSLISSSNNNALIHRQTPLMWACMLGHDEVVTSILVSDAIRLFAEQDIHGRTALMYAVIAGHTALVEHLLQSQVHDTNVLNIRDKYNHTALYYAVKASNLRMVKALLGAGAEVTAQCVRLAAGQSNKEILITLMFKAYKTYGALFGAQHPEAHKLLPSPF